MFFRGSIIPRGLPAVPLLPPGGAGAMGPPVGPQGGPQVTYPPGMTFPPGFNLANSPVTDKDGSTLYPTRQMDRPIYPTKSTSAIRYPLMPKLDVNNTEPCDVVAYFCPKSYKTGKVCGRASYFIYKTFETYCMLDYMNCKERTNIWKIAYMGECIPQTLTDFVKVQPPPIYEYHDDYFLDDIFVMDETFHEDIMGKLEPIHNPVKPG